MTLVAKPNFWVQIKNTALVLLVGVFMVMFFYDGLLGYPKSNDEVVKVIKTKYADKLSTPQNAEIKKILDSWPGWDNVPLEQQEALSNFHRVERFPEKWHNPLDMRTQLIIAVTLALLTILAVWWFIFCLRRLVTADDSGISPARGVKVPWDAITVIDNTYWKKKNIVWITYKDAAGAEKKAKLDDYHLDNLRPILQELEQRATGAQLIAPPDADAPAATSGDAKKA